jgi:hypothetical protein
MTKETNTRTLSHDELQHYQEHYQILLAELNFRRDDYRSKVANLLTRGNVLIAGAGLIFPLLNSWLEPEVAQVKIALIFMFLCAMAMGLIAIRGSYASVPKIDTLEEAFLQRGHVSALHVLIKENAPILASNEKILSSNVRLVNFGYALVFSGLIIDAMARLLIGR